MTLSFLLPVGSNAQTARNTVRKSKKPPIIDMRIHADTMEDFGGGILSICLGDGKMTLLLGPRLIARN